MSEEIEPDPGTGQANLATGVDAIKSSDRAIESPPPSAPAPDPVELALAAAVAKAAAEGRFEVLPTLVAELEARRKARQARQAPEIVDLDAVRRRRDGGS